MYWRTVFCYCTFLESGLENYFLFYGNIWKEAIFKKLFCFESHNIQIRNFIHIFMKTPYRVTGIWNCNKHILGILHSMFSDERLSINQSTFSSVKNLSKLFHSSHWFLIFAFTLITYGHISSTLLLWTRAISCWYQFHVLALKLSHLFYCVTQRGYDLGCLYSYCIRNLCRKYLSLCGQRCRASTFCRKEMNRNGTMNSYMLTFGLTFPPMFL